jgi:hypothetical protein
MFNNFFVSILLDAVVFIIIVGFSWWTYREVMRIVKPRTKREKQKTIFAWLILVFTISSFAVFYILDGLKIFDAKPFLSLIAMLVIIIGICDSLWINSMYRNNQINEEKKG